MKPITGLLAIFAATLRMVLSPAPSHLREKQCPWEVYFSLHGGCTDAVIRELNNAKSAVLLQAYSFTSAGIAKALLSANKTRVRLQTKLPLTE